MIQITTTSSAVRCSGPAAVETIVMLSRDVAGKAYRQRRSFAFKGGARDVESRSNSRSES
jgi:hypothetical protein